MAESKPTAFLAYPSQDELIADTLESSGRLSADEPLQILPWPKLDPIGLKIDDLIREKLDAAQFLIADITV